MVDILRLSPAICAYPDGTYKNLKIEIILQGVEKKNISFKVMKDEFYIKATKEGVEYADSYAVCCPISPEKGRTTYSDGILKVTVLYNSLLRMQLM